MCNYLVRRQGRYAIRRRIPQDLVTHYGRVEVFRSLGTSDPREAAKRCREAAYVLDQEWATLRHRSATERIPRASTGADSIPVIATSMEIGCSMARTRPANGKQVRQSGGSVRVESADMDTHALAVLALENLRRKRDEVAAQGPAQLEAWMQTQRFQLEFNEAVLVGGEFPVWPMARHEAFRNAYRALLTGEGALALPVAAPASAGVTPVPRLEDKHRLFHVFDRWKVAPPSKVPKTVADYSRAVDLFLESGGPMMVPEITRQHVIAFRDYLLNEKKLAAKTTSKHLAGLGSLLTHAMNDGLIETSPARGVTVKADKHAKEARLPFDLSALKAIFASPVYINNDRPLGGAGEAAYWLPLLALYTGARLEEMGQLHPGDVYEEPYLDDDDTERAAWVLNFTDRGEGQGLKNVGSRRRIPVHPKLVELGFIEYAKAAQAEGRERIFHQLKKDKSGHETGNWSKWFGRYLRDTCKVTDTRMVFHSFRHTFKDNCRDAGISPDVGNALTGHSSGDVADNYGGKFPLKQMVRAMERYRVPGLIVIKSGQ